VQYINAKGSLLDGNRIMTINKKNEKVSCFCILLRVHIVSILIDQSLI